MLDPRMPTLAQMKRQQRKQLKQIKSYAEGGNGEINRQRLAKAMEGYLNSRTVRALAIAEVEKVPDNEACSRINALRTQMDQNLHWKEALASCDRRISWHYQPKSYLGVRQVCSLPQPLKAWNIIIKRVIAATHTVGPHIADWRGRGRDHHVQQIAEVLTRPNLSVVIADVKDAFGSVAPDALYQFLNLPDDLIRGAIDARFFAFSHDVEKSRREVLSHYPQYRLRPQGAPPQGLLQGSPTSNAIFSVLLNDLPDQLSENIGCFVYCDNIIVVTETQQSALAVRKSLVEYFIRHPAGPFTLPVEIRSLARDGFDHLGYSFRWLRGQPWIGMSEKNSDSFFSRLEEPPSEGLGGMDYLEACFSSCTPQAISDYTFTAMEHDQRYW